MSEHDWDALVIGAGAGGMAAAARLRAAGYRTLLVESRDRVGGRASSADLDGFRVNTGALVTEVGGENGRLFDELGVDMGVRVPPKPLTLRIGGRDVPMMSGPTGWLFARSLAALGGTARRVRRLRPRLGSTVDEWLDSLRAGPAVHRLMRNLTSALFAAEPSDVPAALLFDYLTKPGGMSTYGAHPDGGIGPWRVLSEHFRRTGGELWLDSEVVRLSFGPDGLVDGALVRRAGETVRVSATLVVSNAGPLATVELCGDAALPTGYADNVRGWSRPGTLITVNFATRTPLRGLDGLMFFAATERLAYAANVTALSPATTPPGWHLYLGASTPHPASGEFDRDAELALLRADLRENFPEFAGSRELSVEFCAGPEWPGQRAIAGHDLPNTTPIANLWNVGDGAREWAGAGQSGCVESARMVVDQILARHPVRPASGTPRTAGHSAR